MYLYLWTTTKTIPRYLQYLRLVLIKKRAVSVWKAEQQQNAQRRLQDAEQHLNEENTIQFKDEGQNNIINAGSVANDGDAEVAPVVSSKDRAAAKVRIAKWRAAQAAQLEQQKVQFNSI